MFVNFLALIETITNSELPTVYLGEEEWLKNAQTRRHIYVNEKNYYNNNNNVYLIKRPY